MFKEFKKFALRGNMIDLAVGVIIGGAFNGIVTSLVNDIIMPILSIFTGNLDFSNWFIAVNLMRILKLLRQQVLQLLTMVFLLLEFLTF